MSAIVHLDVSIHFNAVSVAVRNRGDVININNIVVPSIALPKTDVTFYDIIAAMFVKPAKNRVILMLRNDYRKSTMVAQFVADAMKVPGIGINVMCVGPYTVRVMTDFIVQRIGTHTSTNVNTLSVAHKNATSIVNISGSATWNAQCHKNALLHWHNLSEGQATPCYSYDL